MIWNNKPIVNINIFQNNRQFPKMIVLVISVLSDYKLERLKNWKCKLFIPRIQTFEQVFRREIFFEDNPS